MKPAPADAIRMRTTVTIYRGADPAHRDRAVDYDQRSLEELTLRGDGEDEITFSRRGTLDELRSRGHINQLGRRSGTGRLTRDLFFVFIPLVSTSVVHLLLYHSRNETINGLRS